MKLMDEISNHCGKLDCLNTAFSYQEVIIATNPSHVHSLLKENTLINPAFLINLKK